LKRIHYTIIFLGLAFSTNAQITKIDLGYGFGAGGQQNTPFEIAGYPVEVLLESFVEQHGYARLSHNLKSIQLTHLISINEFSLVNDIYNNVTFENFYDRTVYTNLTYDISATFFSWEYAQLLGGASVNFYIKNKYSSNSPPPMDLEMAEIAHVMRSLLIPNVGLSFGIQKTIWKRLIINFRFEQMLSSYLGTVNYNGMEYAAPKKKASKLSLFLTYSIFKPN